MRVPWPQNHKPPFAKGGGENSRQRALLEMLHVTLDESGLPWALDPPPVKYRDGLEKVQSLKSLRKYIL